MGRRQGSHGQPSLPGLTPSKAKARLAWLAHLSFFFFFFMCMGAWRASLGVAGVGRLALRWQPQLAWCGAMRHYFS